MLDEELRAGLAEWVRPVASLPAPDIRVLRRRARRRGMRRAATAAVMTAVVAATAIGITVGVSRSPAPVAVAPLAAPGTWHPGRWFPAGALSPPDAGPAVAPYVVTTGGGAGRAVVTNVFTGRTTGTISPPPGSSLAGVAAAGDDHTFLLAARGATSVGFYEERLGDSGRPGPLVLVFSLPGRTVPWFAVSPDARVLAYAPADQIRTISLATGVGRSWTAGGGKAIDLSLASDGTLVFEWLPGGSLAHAQARLLDTASPGLGVARVLVPGCANAADLVCLPLSPLITPDGSAVFVTYLFNGKGGLVAQMQEFSARTGRMLRAVTPAVPSQRQVAVCQALWSDPGGSQLTAFCGRAGTIAGGRFSPASWQLPAGSLSRDGESVGW